jgi:hypothetical protein
MTKASAKRVGLALLTMLTLQCLLTPVVDERAAAAPQTEVAFLTQLKGSVQLRRGNETHPIRQSMLLNVNDIVKTGEGGEAVIFQAYAPVKRLRPNQSYTIAKLSPPPPEGAVKPEAFVRLMRQHLSARQRRDVHSPATMGGPDDAIVTLIEPRGSAVLESRPKFAWTSVSRATSYDVTVYDRAEKVLWKTSTSDTTVSYPSDLPSLTPGEYKWEVIARIGDRVTGDSSLYDASSFTLVNEESAAQINADLAKTLAADTGAVSPLYVSALMEYRRFPQAAAELKRALEAAPQDGALWEMLMETYWQMKLWGSREYARRLSQNPETNAETVRMLQPRR